MTTKTREETSEQLMEILRERMPILTDEEIITAALNLYEMHTRPAGETDPLKQ